MLEAKTVPKKRAGKKTPELAVVKNHLPDFVAVGLVRYKDNTYSQVTVKVKGDQAEIIEVDEPNMRAIAIDSLKITVMKKVIDAENF